MSVPRGLSEEEAAVWAKVAATVTPMEGRKAPVVPKPKKTPVTGAVHKPAPVKPAPKPVTVRAHAAGHPVPPPKRHEGLDSHWDRRIKSGAVQPDFTLDLHGHNLDSAYRRLMDGIRQASAMGARVILLITGRERPVDPADRAERRGAIRAKILDWLAASEFSSDIAAVRRAHIRHGGEGALYLVLKRGR